MQMKGKIKEMTATWKEHERNMNAKWKQHESCRSIWNQQNNSSIDFRACLGMDFGFILDLEYAYFILFLQNPGKR